MNTWAEMLSRFSLVIAGVLFLPACLLLGWSIRVWDLDLGYWRSLRKACAEAAHNLPLKIR